MSLPIARLALCSAALASGVLVAVYVALCIHTGNPWPWHEMLHEAGDRSLLGTLLYYEHAARELLLDLVLAVAVAASVRFMAASEPLTGDALDARRLRNRQLRNRQLRNRLGVATLAVVAVIVGGTLLRSGPEVLLHNLAQMHTRPGAPLSWGAHWRYHLLSRATLMLVSMGLAGGFVLLTRGLGGTGGRDGARWFAGSLAAFVGLTVVFLPDLDPLTDPVFIGHQVREVLTHALVTVPAAFAACLWLARPGTPPSGANDGVPVGAALATGAVGCALGLYLLVAGLSLGSGAQGQTTDAVLLVAPHFFEHGFSYVLVALAAGAIHEEMALRAS